MDRKAIMGNSAPDYSSARPDFSSGEAADAEAIQRAADAAVQGLAEARKAGLLVEDPDEEFEGPLRAFYAPLEPNSKFLVKAGTVVWFRSENSPTGRRDMEREGDIWAEFRGGVCATRDPEVIAWCEAHSGSKERHASYHAERGTNPRKDEVDIGLCRDADDPIAATWADMKILTIPTSRRAQQLPSTVNVDEMFQRLSGNFGHGTEGETMANAAASARNADRERTKGR